jgi:hypothetical protein
MLSYEEAQAYVRPLKIARTKGWRRWRARPANIPGHPDRAYRDKGWVSWPHFLGYEPRKTAAQMMPFREARAHVRKCNITSYNAWKKFSRSKARPTNVPSHPDAIYRAKGWVSWPDFLGTSLLSQRRPAEVDRFTYHQAKRYITPFRVKGPTDFRLWKRHHVRPPEFPSHPNRYYSDRGWVSWDDFLGIVPPQHKRPFQELLDAIEIATRP